MVDDAAKEANGNTTCEDEEDHENCIPTAPIKSPYVSPTSSIFSRL